MVISIVIGHLKAFLILHEEAMNMAMRNTWRIAVKMLKDEAITHLNRFSQRMPPTTDP